MVYKSNIPLGEAVIERASAVDDLNEAVRMVQDAIGQDDGGLAGMYFSDRFDPTETWRAMTRMARVADLELYLELEALHAEADPSFEPG